MYAKIAFYGVCGLLLAGILWWFLYRTYVIRAYILGKKGWRKEVEDRIAFLGTVSGAISKRLHAAGMESYSKDDETFISDYLDTKGVGDVAYYAAPIKKMNELEQLSRLRRQEAQLILGIERLKKHDLPWEDIISMLGDNFAELLDEIKKNSDPGCAPGAND